MSLLDWFKKVYHQGKDDKSPSGSHQNTPYYHMPEDRPNKTDRHNTQQDLIDAIRKAGENENPEMISALIEYIGKRAGIKTFAANDQFIKNVFNTRNKDIRNIINEFFDDEENRKYLPDQESIGELSIDSISFIENFTNSVIKKAEDIWLQREFKEIETETAIGPDGKEHVFEKGAVPEGYEILNKETEPSKEDPLNEIIPTLNKPVPEISTEPTPVPQKIEENPIASPFTTTSPIKTTPFTRPKIIIPPSVSQEVPPEVPQQVLAPIVEPPIQTEIQKEKVFNDPKQNKQRVRPKRIELHQRESVF